MGVLNSTESMSHIANGSHTANGNHKDHLSAWQAPNAVIGDVESTGLDRCSCCHIYDATRKAWFAAAEALAVYCHCDEVQKVHQARNPI